MIPRFRTDNEARTYLSDGFRRSCAARQLEYYTEYRNQGMPVDLAVDRAQFSHQYLDHGDRQKYADFPIETDGDVYEEITRASYAEMNDPSYRRKDVPVNEKIDTLFYYYALYRSWDFNIGFSLFKAMQTSTAVLTEKYPNPVLASDETAIEDLLKLPHPIVAKAMVVGYKNLRERGVSIEDAYVAVLQFADRAIGLQDILGPITGFSDKSDLPPHPTNPDLN